MGANPTHEPAVLVIENGLTEAEIKRVAEEFFLKLPRATTEIISCVGIVTISGLLTEKELKEAQNVAKKAV